MAAAGFAAESASRSSRRHQRSLSNYAELEQASQDECDMLTIATPAEVGRFHVQAFARRAARQCLVSC